LLDRIRSVVGRIVDGAFETGRLVAVTVVDEAGADGAVDDRQFWPICWPILPGREIAWPMFGACKALKLKEKDRFFELCWPMSWPICARPQLLAAHHAVSCLKMTEHRPPGDMARRLAPQAGAARRITRKNPRSLTSSQ
jgi:hypothetical protein